MTDIMRDIIKHLGVKLDEHFMVKPKSSTTSNPYDDSVCYFTEFGLRLIEYHGMIITGMEDDYDDITNEIFYRLAVGSFVVKNYHGNQNMVKCTIFPIYQQVYLLQVKMIGIIILMTIIVMKLTWYVRLKQKL